MKLVAFLFILILSGSNLGYAGSCKGNLYTRADNGEFALERVQFYIAPISREALVVTRNGDTFNLEFKKKSDDWFYYSYVDQNDLLRVRGYRDSSKDFDYSTLRPNRESYFRFKESAVIGFNYICRM